MVSSLLLLTEGGGGVHGQAYVSIADLEITIYEEFPMLSFWVKIKLLTIKIFQKTRKLSNFSRGVLENLTFKPCRVVITDLGVA